MILSDRKDSAWNLGISLALTTLRIKTIINDKIKIILTRCIFLYKKVPI